MDMTEIIRKTKHGEALTREEIEYMISGFVREKDGIPDYQVSAFCMAVYFNGMNDEETAALTGAMARSGDMLDLSRFGTRSVDKHSTGGVGDKTSRLVLAEYVTMDSGTGCVHTAPGFGADDYQ
ncbi:MAG: class I tRNA ligase family protein, partial [Clostridia bacterium]|nr:class I tRNA ligase family protein [Clostridia bacterium]